MSQFGRTLFGASGFVRWTLSPLMLIFAVFMLLLVDGWTPSRIALMAGMELACLCLLAGFWLPRRFGAWAFRVLAGLVFFAYAYYVVHQFFLTNASSRSGLLSLMGFLIIGVPSFWYAWKGRFSLHPEVSEEELMEERAQYEELLFQPDWAFYEAHLQRPVPVALRDLYAERAILLGEVEWPKDMDLGRFEPIREGGLLDTQEIVGFEILPVAFSGCGDPIYLRPGAKESDAVYMTYHDGGGTVVVAGSAEEFLERLRRVGVKRTA